MHAGVSRRVSRRRYACGACEKNESCEGQSKGQNFAKVVQPGDRNGKLPQEDSKKHFFFAPKSTKIY